MNRLFLLGILFFTSVTIGWAADQIVLKEGKTISGTIIDEDPDVVTIKFGAGMVLRVEKEKIQTIVREPKPQSTRPTVTTHEVKKVTPQTSPTPPPVFNFEEKVETKKTEKDNVVTHDTVQVKLYPVAGPDAKEVQQATVKLNTTWTGTPTLEDGTARWKALVIVATSTVSLPFWSPANPPDVATSQKWEKTVREINTLNQKRLGIYQDAFSSLGAGLLSLRASSEADLKKESAQFYKTWLDRTEKRRHGFERRRTTGSTKPLTKR